jgi:putative addiction module component (TIGR02574 family)
LRLVELNPSVALRRLAESSKGCSMIMEKIPAVAGLTAGEKLLLVTELWDDLALKPDEIPVSSDQIAELDRRMEAYRADPEKVTTWEAIKSKIRTSR